MKLKTCIGKLFVVLGAVLMATTPVYASSRVAKRPVPVTDSDEVDEEDEDTDTVEVSIGDDDEEEDEDTVEVSIGDEDEDEDEDEDTLYEEEDTVTKKPTVRSSTSRTNTTTTKTATTRTTTSSGRKTNSAYSTSNGSKAYYSATQLRKNFGSLTNPEKGTRPISMIRPPFNGFIYGDFGTFNSLASENKLGGTPIYLLGAIKSVEKLAITGGNYYAAFLIDDVDGYQWCATMDIPTNSFDIFKNAYTGKTAYIYGLYNGYSVDLRRPLMKLAFVTEVAMPAVPAAAVPAAAVPATAVPATAVPATAVPATAVPATAVPATAVPATAVPATAVPATAVPTAAVPAATTTVVPTAANATQVPSGGVN